MSYFPQCIAVMVLFLLGVVNGARILGMFPMPVKSHSMMNNALMKELASRGHQVTVFSPYPLDKPTSNYTDIEFKVTYADITKSQQGPNWFGPKGFFKPMINMLWQAGTEMCDIMYQHEFVQSLINAKEKQFDLLLIGAFMNDCVIGLAHKFQVPIIEVCTFKGVKWMDEWVGNPTPYSVVPITFSGFTDRMTFWQRLVNTISELYIKVGRHFYFIPKQNAILKKYLNYTDNPPTIYDLEKNISLVLVNTHFSISYPRAIMPNYIEVGGLHVKQPKKLPTDIQKYLDDAPNGVIYFSMGSNLRSANFPEHKRQAFLNAFSKLKLNILWKWETDSLPGQPSNVKLGKWLPQSDILAHPNVKLFMTHGGLLSTLETMNRGVPVVGIPIYGDQYLNMVRTVNSGVGIKLDFENVTEESLTWALNEVLGNPTYRESAQRVSRIFRDQPLTPMEQAVYWTEYVIRHNGAPHMRSAALDLSWYQYFLLDVIAVLTLVIGSVILCSFLILKTVLKKCKRSRQIDSAKKKN